MATKRLDQLPSGSDFDMNDLVMIEQDPDTFDRKLVKTSLSDFMGSALKFDPERFGQNPITGFQSQFQWLMSSMNTLSNMSLLSETLEILNFKLLRFNSKISKMGLAYQVHSHIGHTFGFESL